MRIAPVISAAAERLALYERVTKLIEGAFIFDDDMSMVVRRSSVHRAVAQGLSKPWLHVNVNGDRRRMVLEIVTMKRVRPILRGNRPLFRGMRARGVSKAEAASLSRKLLDTRKPAPLPEDAQ